MDHTPGKRQWRDPTALKSYMSRNGMTAAEIEASLAKRIERGSLYAPQNWTAVLALFAPAAAARADWAAPTVALAVGVAAGAAAGCAAAAAALTTAATPGSAAAA